MTHKCNFFGGAVLALAMTLSPQLLAQDIDFGDDSSSWANDGQCDDPRFSGDGAALFASPLDAARDATDCQAAYEAGTVTFVGQDPEDGAAVTPADPGATTGDADIDFGDDSGTFANDGECDDPRFGGVLASHEMADATDCRTAFEAGTVEFSPAPVGETTLDATDIDFGSNAGEYAMDGECDDPRFEGAGMGVALSDHLSADADDCRAAFEAGTVTYLGEDIGTSDPVSADEIDFGDDSGEYALDAECDDPRFEGAGMGASLESHRMADASDCSTAYEDGTVTWRGAEADPSDFRINFGDDSAASAFDGVCDDPRFQGRGAAPELFEANLLADASDCRAAYDAGTVSYAP